MIEPIRVVVGAALLVLAFGAGWLAAPRPHPLPPTVCVAEPVAPAAPEKVKITVETDPPGARMVFPDGFQRRTPITFEEPRGDQPFKVRLYLDGHFIKGLVIRPDLDRDYLVMLERNDVDILRPNF